MLPLLPLHHHQGLKQHVSSDAYILRNVSTDRELKQLYTALGVAADNHDAVQAFKLCQLIKERKVQISDAANAVSFDPEEKAAVVSADQEAASAVLDRIFALGASASSDEFRAAVELADLVEQGGLHLDVDPAILCRRRLSAWCRACMVSCGDARIALPDDGLILTILGLAAKEGSAQMARVCLHQIDPTFNELNPIPSPRPAQLRIRPVDHHRDAIYAIEEYRDPRMALGPLFEAYCSAHDYEGALPSLQLAVGTHIAIVNAVLTAAVWLGDLAQALEIYRAIPTYHAIASPSGAQAHPPNYTNVSTELDTFNSLLSGCIDAADYETGVDF
ncbi:uncharacterized protein UTRI_02380 [Ustilago trichophora]|uniref:Uncharacterized protein n=1 Tax=Ustilago trichophora TaxID=86804 RepID=A0A5C3E7Q5_9BASI|nr:uncharacterized protein UTRI_02380 [Ustilago trichophora]